MNPARGDIMKHDLVFLFDVDNTLLDADRITLDLGSHLDKMVGHDRQQRYWTLFKQLRDELGYADYLGALQRYRVEQPRDPHALELSRFLINYPFEQRLFPGALRVIARLKQEGQVVLVTDGDAVFQPHKIERAGLFAAVDGHVWVSVRKEEELAEIEATYPADHYVLVDDKLRILSLAKAFWGSRVTTVLPRQGRYARALNGRTIFPEADVTVERIADLLQGVLDAVVLSLPAVSSRVKSGM
jgi:FMN phosphatase YigB (HAD superfamily)